MTPVAGVSASSAGARSPWYWPWMPAEEADTPATGVIGFKSA